ncbi:MAG: ferritin-like domain-containing protein [Sandaracinaceae bacterium]
MTTGPRTISHAGGGFAALFEERIGARVDVSDLDLTAHPRERIELARRVWQDRVRTEFRSIQIMTRWLTEVVGAGDPLEVYAAAIDMIEDEVRHVGLTEQLVLALGGQAFLPDPIPLRDPAPYLAAPMAERALTTAIQMLAINETISVAFIEDLHARCADPAVHRVLAATCEDEEGHQELGWTYVATSLARFPRATLDSWRHLVKVTLEPHDAAATRALADVPAARRALQHFAEPELAALGLFSPARQALVYERVRSEILEPKLRALELL